MAKPVRLPGDVLRRLDLQVVDTLHLVEVRGGDGPRLVLSKTPLIPDRVDALVAHWERELANKQAQATLPHSPKDE